MEFKEEPEDFSNLHPLSETAMLTITQPNQVIHESIIMNYLSFIAKTCYSTKVTVTSPHYAAQFTMESQENGYTNVRNVYEFTYLNRDDFDLMLIPLKDYLVQNWAIGIFDMRMKKLDFFEAKNRIFDWHRDVMKKAIANIKPGVGYHSDFDIVNKGPWTKQDNETGVYVCYIAEEYIRRQGVIESQYFNYHEDRRRIYTILDQQMKAMGLRSHSYSEQDFKFPIRLTKLLTQHRETGTVPELVTLEDEEELPATPQAFSTTPQPSSSSINIEQNIPTPSVSQNISLVNTIDSITSSLAMENNEGFRTPQNPAKRTSSRRSSRISSNHKRSTSGSASCKSGIVTKKVRPRPAPMSGRGSGRPGSRSQEFEPSSAPETSQERIVQNANYSNQKYIGLNIEEIEKLPKFKPNFVAPNWFQIPGYDYTFRINYEAKAWSTAQCIHCQRVYSVKRNRVKNLASKPRLPSFGTVILKNGYVYGHPEFPRGIKHICEIGKKQTTLPLAPNLISSTSPKKKTSQEPTKPTPPMEKRKNMRLRRYLMEKSMPKWTPNFINERIFTLGEHPYRFQLRPDGNEVRKLAYCYRCLIKSKKLHRKGEKSTFGYLVYMKEENAIFGDPVQPKGMPHICDKPSEPKASQPQMNKQIDKQNSDKPTTSSNQVQNQANLPQPLTIQKAHNTKSYVQLNKLRRARAMPMDEVKKMPVWDPIFIGQYSFKIPGYPYHWKIAMSYRKPGWQLRHTATCSNCQGKKVLLRKKGMTYMLGTMIYIPEEKKAYGDPDLPRGKSHLCDVGKNRQNGTINKTTMSNEISMSTTQTSTNVNNSSLGPQSRSQSLNFNLTRPVPDEEDFLEDEEEEEKCSTRTSLIQTKNVAQERPSIPSLPLNADEPREMVPGRASIIESTLANSNAKKRIVTSYSSFTKTIEVNDTPYHFAYPHADHKAPVVHPTNPENLPRDEFLQINDTFKFNILKMVEKEGPESRIHTKNLLITDSILIGFNEESLANCHIIRAEFPMMPSWLLRVVLKSKQLRNFMFGMETIFYALGYDMLRCYEHKKTEEIASMMSKELIELIETIMLSDGDENMAPKKKNLIFVTIPSIGIMRDKIDSFNEGMRNEINKFSKKYESEVEISLIDWEKSVRSAEERGFLSDDHTVDDRIKLLLREMRNQGIRLRK